MCARSSWRISCRTRPTCPSSSASSLPCALGRSARSSSPARTWCSPRPTSVRWLCRRCIMWRAVVTWLCPTRAWFRRSVACSRKRRRPSSGVGLASRKWSMPPASRWWFTAALPATRAASSPVAGSPARPRPRRRLLARCATLTACRPRWSRLPICRSSARSSSMPAARIGTASLGATRGTASV